MKENLYKRLPPLERRPDGSLCRMTPAQRKQANGLIRRECCSCEGGDCIALDDGDGRLPPDDSFLRLPFVVPLGGLAAGQNAGSQSAAGAEKWIAFMKACVNPTEPTAELLNTPIEKSLSVKRSSVRTEAGNRRWKSSAALSSRWIE